MLSKDLKEELNLTELNNFNIVLCYNVFTDIDLTSMSYESPYLYNKVMTSAIYRSDKVYYSAKLSSLHDIEVYLDKIVTYSKYYKTYEQNSSIKFKLHNANYSIELFGNELDDMHQQVIVSPTLVLVITQAYYKDKSDTQCCDIRYKVFEREKFVLADGNHTYYKIKNHFSSFKSKKDISQIIINGSITTITYHSEIGNYTLELDNGESIFLDDINYLDVMFYVFGFYHSVFVSGLFERR